MYVITQGFQVHLCRGVGGDTPRSEAHEIAWDLVGIQEADAYPPRMASWGSFATV